jgi:hypothetical protein
LRREVGRSPPRILARFSPSRPNQDRLAGQCNPGDTECQVREVVQYRHVEDCEKCGIGVMAGEGELVIVRGDARNKAEHADGQKHCADCKGSFLDGRPKFRAGFGRGCRMDAVINRLP